MIEAWEKMWRGKRVSVLGLGASGVACAGFLARSGAVVTAADTRLEPPGLSAVRGLPNVSTQVGGMSEALGECDVLVLSPGLSPLQEPVRSILVRARASGAEAVGEIELFARALAGLERELGYRPKVIGITGTNGKTTTTVLTTRMAAAGGLKALAAGNIGPNALSELEKALQTGELPAVWVLELSSFQLETTTSLRLDAGAILNVTQDHVDWHGSFDAYASAKAHIWRRCAARVLPSGGVAGSTARSGDRTFSAAPPEGDLAYGLRNGRLCVGKTALIDEASLRLRGRHNTLNALAALALIDAAGFSREAALSALREYSGEAHRVQTVFTAPGGIEVVDDSKGTNVGAAAAALCGLGEQGRRLFVIMGGDGKGQDFAPLAEPVARYCEAVALIGRDARAIERSLAATGVDCERADTLEEAVALLWRKAARVPDGAVLLLSPACASWDMFRDYAHRAQLFIEAARACAAKEAEGA